MPSGVTSFLEGSRSVGGLQLLAVAKIGEVVQ
eukprot:UN06228